MDGTTRSWSGHVAVTGLVVGKPIWSSDGKVEAGLKAFFGALLGVGALLASRHFATVELDLRAVGAGKDELCKLPFVVFPAIGMVLGAFFELDHTGSSEEAEAGSVTSAQVAR